MYIFNCTQLESLTIVSYNLYLPLEKLKKLKKLDALEMSIEKLDKSNYHVFNSMKSLTYVMLYLPGDVERCGTKNYFFKKRQVKKELPNTFINIIKR